MRHLGNTRGNNLGVFIDLRAIDIQPLERDATDLELHATIGEAGHLVGEIVRLAFAVGFPIGAIHQGESTGTVGDHDELDILVPDRIQVIIHIAQRSGRIMDIIDVIDDLLLVVAIVYLYLLM